MVVLLECQKKTSWTEEDMLAFAISVLCHMLDILEIDLSTNEKRDLELFIKEWCKE